MMKAEDGFKGFVNMDCWVAAVELWGFDVVLVMTENEGWRVVASGFNEEAEGLAAERRMKVIVRL